MVVFLIYNQNKLVAAVQHERHADQNQILQTWLKSQGLTKSENYRIDLCPVILWQSLLNSQKPCHEQTQKEKTVVLTHAGGYETFVFNVQHHGKTTVENQNQKEQTLYSTPLEALLDTVSSQCGWLS